ncbi:unnamed protein product [Mytilus edulis]|uniref:Uncharacterized protein n=1 Tax=Mytilus edulis TaxID=6550 RepID=A0A8S3UJH9_MYTED|nr:unnamed protein product [Mytilus edulis]
MSENGMIQKVDLYQIWEQEEFRQILPFKEYIFDMLIHLDIVSEQRRYDTKTGSRLPIENFFVPCMLTQRNDTDFLTQECTPERTLSLAFVFKGTIIPPALPNRLICACLKGNKILLYLVHKRSKGLIVPEIATSVRECLHLTLERISEFYQSTVHEKVISQLPFHTDYSCSRFICYFPEERLALKTDECVCNHGDDITLNWKVWNQKQKQKQCDPDCTGLSEDALSQIPSNTELLRLSVNCATRMIHDLALHLDMEESEWSDMVENYPRNTQMVKFLTLIDLKENNGIRFGDLAKGLIEMKITTHTLCMMRRRKQVISSIQDDILDSIPTDEILDNISTQIGKMVFQLGIELGLSIADLENIDKCNCDLTAQSKEVL